MDMRLFFLNSELGLWILRPIVPAPGISDGDCGEIGGMKIGRGNRSTRRQPAPASLCPQQIPHD
jgi:hypothetical protein